MAAYRLSPRIDRPSAVAPLARHGLVTQVLPRADRTVSQTRSKVITFHTIASVSTAEVRRYRLSGSETNRRVAQKETETALKQLLRLEATSHL
jgi:hypothetical protein